jgi:hypothetical protein
MSGQGLTDPYARSELPPRTTKLAAVWWYGCLRCAVSHLDHSIDVTNRATCLFFAATTSGNERIVEAARPGLEYFIRESKIPKDILQVSLMAHILCKAHG